ncbi:hypothetical protein ES703_63865 [subsurface metagenome]
MCRDLLLGLNGSLPPQVYAQMDLTAVANKQAELAESICGSLLHLGAETQSPQEFKGGASAVSPGTPEKQAHQENLRSIGERARAQVFPQLMQKKGESFPPKEALKAEMVGIFAPQKS